MLYHGTSVQFDFTGFNDTGFLNSSMFGRGVYLTTCPHDASKSASTDLRVNHDLVPKADLLAKSVADHKSNDVFGAYYGKAKSLLTAGGGCVIPVYTSAQKLLTISPKGLCLTERVFHLAAAEAGINRDEAARLLSSSIATKTA